MSQNVKITHFFNTLSTFLYLHCKVVNSIYNKVGIENERIETNGKWELLKGCFASMVYIMQGHSQDFSKRGHTVQKRGFSPDFHVVFTTSCRLFA